LFLACVFCLRGGRPLLKIKGKRLFGGGDIRMKTKHGLAALVLSAGVLMTASPASAQRAVTSGYCPKGTYAFDCTNRPKDLRNCRVRPNCTASGGTSQQPLKPRSR